MIRWNASRHSANSVPVDHYVIQYRTVGQWVPLSSNIPANQTWYLWGTASRGALYHFRVWVIGKQAHSDASKVVSLRTGGRSDQTFRALVFLLLFCYFMAYDIFSSFISHYRVWNVVSGHHFTLLKRDD